MTFQEAPTLMMGIFALIQALFLLAITPLCTGISRTIRAKMHSRRGLEFCKIIEISLSYLNANQ